MFGKTVHSTPDMKTICDVFKDRLSESVVMTVLIAQHAVQTPCAKCTACAYP